MARANNVVSVQVSPKSLEIFKDLKKLATSRTLLSIQKKAAVSAKRKMFTAIQREIRKERSLKIAEIREQIKPVFSAERVGYRVSGTPVPLVSLPHRFTKTGVKFMSRKSKGWVTVPSVFRARVRSVRQQELGIEGHVGAFRRVGTERLPIKQLYAPGLSVAFLDEARREAVVRVALEEYEKTFLRLARARFDAIG